MALKARITKAEFDALGEAIRKEYKADGEAYVIDVVPTDGWNLENISGLTSTLSKIKAELKTAKETLAAFDNDGDPIDPKDALKALKRVKELEALDPKKLAEEQVKSALEQARAEFEKASAPVKKRAEALETKLRTVLIDQQATAALAAKGGNVKLLLPLLRGQLKIVEEDGDFRVKVLGADGNPRIMVKDGKAEDMTIDAYVAEMAGSQDYAPAFSAKGSPGAGSAGSSGLPAPGAAGVIKAQDLAANPRAAKLEDIASGKVQVDMTGS